MKNIIITGSSNGFGLKAAKDFADKGNKVFATIRNPNGKNANAKADLENHSANIKVVDMDVTNDASVKEAMSTILSEAGNIDILINNAGIMYLGITEAFSIEQAKFQMETNYFGAIRVMQAILPSMRKAGTGLIINTSSLVGRMSPPFFGTYTATKHALEGYSQALRYEVSPFGVDIVLVEPGPFGTGLLASGQAPAHNEVLETYGELAGVPSAMGENFAQMLQSEDAPDPQWVVDAYLKLADLPFGSRPTRTVVGITWGTDEINDLTQPIQDRILKEMQLESVLGGVSG
ncbi:NADP-dependent 3-hydroxy acid dehydrogenase YdfG [Cyclobacterium xiamenense]|uniref:NADP-dependent 3-hydroxy acid dehydrogenase YdfG n=1 Tax=Cyclobacterium xiamenense TaxID=1297121 RepID=A0A1H7C9H3_9BACT|nr:SDR family oxidoreductase [Cyclobacterium xiamenense]SEJ82295.1 NADP-dependent 3-hydroxy acid dehydrogenase YdfG [Cyclobacterium xiamenense]